jgi:hypothetical protein
MLGSFSTTQSATPSSIPTMCFTAMSSGRAKARLSTKAGGRSPSMKLDEIVDLINRGMTFYRTFIDTDEKHRGSYTEEKQVRGRIGAGGSEEDVTLMASAERGLYGFRG